MTNMSTIPKLKTDLARLLHQPLAAAPQLAALNDLPIGVALLDADQRVRFMNRSLATLVGLSPDAAMGLPCNQVVRAAACVHTCLACSPTDPRRTFETDVLSRSRKRVPVRLSCLPLRDDNGDIVGFIEVFEDQSKLRELERKLAGDSGGNRIQWRSPEMEKVIRMVPILGASAAPVLITGETGTGKDLLAEALHAASPHSREPFIRVNLGSLPAPQLESELFGHVRGAFPWAETDKPGCFQTAGGGTVYLAEVSDLPPPLQTKLIRLLDERVVLPVGGHKLIPVKARIMAATNRDPEMLVHEGRLLDGLLHRLGVLRENLPPLRQRKGDTEFLLQHFLETFAKRLKKDIGGFTPRAKRILLQYAFPGNVRELMNVVEYTVMVCPKGQVLPAHLPAYILEGKATNRVGRRSARREARS